MNLKHMTGIVAIILLLIAACGGNGSDKVTSISDAANADDGTDAELTGFIISVSGETRICSEILESFPPQCGGANVLVLGLDLASLDTQTEGNVTWTNQDVTLTGTIEDGALEVED